METREVVIVGGGPSGSTAAWKLKQAGMDVLVLDKASFPRWKPCAGWITPEVVADLKLREDGYPHPLLEIKEFKIALRKIPISMKMEQYSIRRTEFDDWLLKRSGAEIRQFRVEKIEERDGLFILNDTIRAKYLIGAGGTGCPVARHFFESAKRPRMYQAVTLEEEFPTDIDFRKDVCHIRFFDGGMPGYSWVVPKGNGYLNVGIGAMANNLKKKGMKIQDLWNDLTTLLDRKGIVPMRDYQPSGHNYYLAPHSEPEIQKGNVFITGDAIGLATRDFAEGIGPSVVSAIRVADTILRGSDYRVHDIYPYSAAKRWVGFFIEKRMIG